MELTKENEEEDEPSEYVGENFVDDDDLQEALKRTRKLAMKKKAKKMNSIEAIAQAGSFAFFFFFLQFFLFLFLSFFPSFLPSFHFSF